jgi:hypothetical protein
MNPAVAPGVSLASRRIRRLWPEGPMDHDGRDGDGLVSSTGVRCVLGLAGGEKRSQVRLSGGWCTSVPLPFGRLEVGEAA